MKSVGVVRKLDQLGRIVLPMELRKTYNIDIKDPLEIFTDGDKIILRKYKSELTCMFSGDISTANFVFSKGQIVLNKDYALQLFNELKEYVGE